MVKDATERAAQARRLLDEPLLKEALEKLESDALETMLGLPITDDETRRRLCDRIIVIREFREHLRSAVTSGADALRPRPVVP